MLELERIFKENGGYFGKRRIWDIFNIWTGSLLSSDILKNWATKRISVKSDNNGIIWSYETLHLPEARHFENFISVNFFGWVFYHPYCASVEMKVHTLKWKNFEFTNSSWLYFTSIIQKILNWQFSYWNQLSSSKLKDWDFFIELPLTKTWEIAFEYMEDYIRFLEAYLLATWLKDYNLTEKEQKALDRFEEMLTLDLIWSDLIWSDLIWSDRVNIAFRKFRIGDLFNVLWTKSLDSNVVEFLDEWVNFVWRTFENNWIQWKIARRDFEPNEPFSLTATVIWNYKYVKFQREEYYCSQNINKITPKENFFVWNKFIAYFVWTWIQKFVSLYDWQQWGYKLDDIKSTELLIPTLNWQIDFEFMENFIRAVEKLVIKDLVIWNEKKMNAYREVISKKNFK